MHQAQNAAAGKKTLTAELVGLRVGDFVLVTFPGELTRADRAEHQEDGRRTKRPSSPATPTATSTMPPTDEQLRNARLGPRGLRLPAGPRLADAF